MARNTKSLTISRFHQIEDCEVIPEDIKSAARTTVAHFVARQDGTAEDASELMRMLGLYPGEEDLSCYLTGPPTMPGTFMDKPPR